MRSIWKWNTVQICSCLRYNNKRPTAMCFSLLLWNYEFWVVRDLLNFWWQILSCEPITWILHAAAVPDGKKKHSMFYGVFVSDFCELNEIMPKPIQILWNMLVLCVKVRMGLSMIACIEFICHWFLLIELHFSDGAWKRPKLTKCSKVLEIWINYSE